MARKPTTGQRGSSGRAAKSGAEKGRSAEGEQAADTAITGDDETGDGDSSPTAAPDSAQEDNQHDISPQASRAGMSPTTATTASATSESPEQSADAERAEDGATAGQAVTAPDSDDAGERDATSAHGGNAGNRAEAAEDHGVAADSPDLEAPAPDSAEPDRTEPDRTEPERRAPRGQSEPAPAPRPDGKRVFFAMLLGGLVAGAIGFGVRHYFGAVESAAIEQQLAALRQDLRQETAASLAQQADRLAALEARSDGAEPPDLSEMKADISRLKTDLAGISDRLAKTETALSDLAERVSSLEARSLTGNASRTAVEAYEAELRKLQQAMAAQRAEIEAMMSEAVKTRSDAEKTAQATRRQAALSRILTALDAGAGYASALIELESTGVQVPDILWRNAETGVATLSELQAEFPDAARAALAAAREAELKSGQGDGWKAFLLKQLGARSLKPREGDDPDAVLSRAEAAVRDGRLTDALAEIETLPDVAKAELAAWVEKARQRLAAINAAQALSDELN